MKCLLRKGNPISVRVSNLEAAGLTAGVDWEYCPKRIWKETGRFYKKEWVKSHSKGGIK